MAFVNLARSGNKLTIEEQSGQSSSDGKRSFLPRFFKGKKDDTTQATQLKAAARIYQQTIKPVIYDPITVLDEILPEVDPRLVRFKPR